MKPQETIFQKYKAIQELGTTVEVPMYAWSLFSDKAFNIEVFGDHVSCGSDYMSMVEARQAVEFFVKQLCGEVKWKKARLDEGGKE